MIAHFPDIEYWESRCCVASELFVHENYPKAFAIATSFSLFFFKYILLGCVVRFS